jgi:hypothetical protein
LKRLQAAERVNGMTGQGGKREGIQPASGLRVMATCVFGAWMLVGGPSAVLAAPSSVVVEPAVTGQVVDGDTGKPLGGVAVFGYYATSDGSWGGGQVPSGTHRRFAVLTDMQGAFTLDAWTLPALPAGERRERFPVLAVFKPGYRARLVGMNSIASLLAPATPAKGVAARPELMVAGVAPGNRVALTPASSAAERYIDLRAAGMAMDLGAPCAWETYAAALQLMHDELKALIRQTVPAIDLDDHGYLRSGRPHPLVNVDFLTRSLVDRLVLQHRSKPSTWACSDPSTLFRSSPP